ncbi:MAG TPA: HEAT repeat domain-containing protein [Planctomycetota bacterium]|nr:HEAT repeat domain-containing protein [Planctomycetota bacterium]
MVKVGRLFALAVIPVAVAVALVAEGVLGAWQGGQADSTLAAAPSRESTASATTAAGMPPPVPAHAAMREWRRFCASADRGAAPDLRRVALSAGDPLIAGNALRALGRLQLVACDRQLCALLADPRPRVRQEAVIAMGRSGEPTAVAAIAPLLQDDPTLRSLAIEALGRLGGSQARALLEQIVSDPRSTPTDAAFARPALARIEAGSGSRSRPRRD